MPSLHDLFTPVDELVFKKPSYFDTNNEDLSAAVAFSQKTPAMVLDEGSRRVYGVAPEYQLISEVPSFGFSCHLMNKTVTGYGKTKKAAKHLAARAMLHEMIEKDRHFDFGIPGKTKEDAHRAVEGLAVGDIRMEQSDEDPALSCGQNENYSGRLLQLCHKNKFEVPQYSYKEEGPPNDRTFVTTCTVVDEKVEGVAKTKKASKNLASQKMIAVLEKGLVRMNKEPELDPDLEEDGNPSVSKLQCAAPTTSDAVKMVSEILSDTKRFESSTQEYRILEHKCAFGLTQCLLKITFSKPGEQQSRYVFPGSHTTEEGARQRAARAAILFFNS